MRRASSRTVGEVLRSAREARGVTQRDVAQAIGVDRTHVSAIETGRVSPSLAALGRLARALELTPADQLEIIRLAGELDDDETCEGAQHAA